MHKKLSLNAFIFPLIIILLILVAIPFLGPIKSILESKEEARALMNSLGILAPIVFIAMQILQVVIFIIPGEAAQIAGGWLFGPILGTLYSIIGIAIGSLINFTLARFLGRLFVEGLFGEKDLLKLESILSSSKASFGFFLLFLIPGIPKDILCYAAGISTMGFFPFLLVSMIARMPGIVGSSLIGSSAAEGDFKLSMIILIAACVLFCLGLFFQDKIRAWISSKMTKYHT